MASDRIFELSKRYNLNNKADLLKYLERVNSLENPADEKPDNCNDMKYNNLIERLQDGSYLNVVRVSYDTTQLYIRIFQIGELAEELKNIYRIQKNIELVKNNNYSIIMELLEIYIYIKNFINERKHKLLVKATNVTLNRADSLVYQNKHPRTFSDYLHRFALSDIEGEEFKLKTTVELTEFIEKFNILADLKNKII